METGHLPPRHKCLKGFVNRQAPASPSSEADGSQEHRRRSLAVTRPFSPTYPRTVAPSHIQPSDVVAASPGKVVDAPSVFESTCTLVTRTSVVDTLPYDDAFKS